MTARSIAFCGALIACTSLLAACSQNGLLSSGMTTGSIDPQQQAAAKAQEEACLTLASQIETLNTEGVPGKIEKAAAKKYKLKSADITKVDELNKANSEFQTKCSKYPPKPAPITAEQPAETGSQKTAAKPPLPPAKSVATAMAPESTATAAPAAPAP